MAEVSTERKKQVLQHIYEVRQVKGHPVIEKHNLPIWVDDCQAARSLVEEGVLEEDPHNDDGDCYRAGYRFAEGLRKYGIVSGNTMAMSCAKNKGDFESRIW